MQKDNEKEEDIKKQVEVPDIEGLSIEEAIKILKEVNLELQIKDEPEEYNKKETIVKEQLPKRGINMYEGTKVIVTIWHHTTKKQKRTIQKLHLVI